MTGTNKLPLTEGKIQLGKLHGKNYGNLELLRKEWKGWRETALNRDLTEMETAAINNTGIRELKLLIQADERRVTEIENEDYNPLFFKPRNSTYALYSWKVV